MVTSNFRGCFFVGSRLESAGSTIVRWFRIRRVPVEVSSLSPYLPRVFDIPGWVLAGFLNRLQLLNFNLYLRVPYFIPCFSPWPNRGVFDHRWSLNSAHLDVMISSAAKSHLGKKVGTWRIVPVSL